MRSLTEFLAMATLGLVVMWLLRRRLRRMMTVAVVMGASRRRAGRCHPTAGAAELKHGDPNYTLATGRNRAHRLDRFGGFHAH